jgi:hypothetical protein
MALRSALSELASHFTQDVFDIIRSASLEDLLGGGRTSRPKSSLPARASSGPGRLPRRSAREIAAALENVVVLLKKHDRGLRAEHIRAQLGMQATEMPRVLKEGLARKALKAKGQKRATTYWAAG